MKTTPTLIILTADDFPLGSCIDRECEELVRKAGCGKHLYGGKHYSGHHVVFRKRDLKQSRLHQFHVTKSAVKAQVALNQIIWY